MLEPKDSMRSRYSAPLSVMLTLFAVVAVISSLRVVVIALQCTSPTELVERGIPALLIALATSVGCVLAERQAAATLKREQASATAESVGQLG